MPTRSAWHRSGRKRRRTTAPSGESPRRGSTAADSRRRCLGHRHLTGAVWQRRVLSLPAGEGSLIPGWLQCRVECDRAGARCAVGNPLLGGGTELRPGARQGAALGHALGVGEVPGLVGRLPGRVYESPGDAEDRNNREQQQQRPRHPLSHPGHRAPGYIRWPPDDRGRGRLVGRGPLLERESGHARLPPIARAASVDADVSVVCVDNGSTDGSIEAIRAEHPGHRPDREWPQPWVLGWQQRRASDTRSSAARAGSCCSTTTP